MKIKMKEFTCRICGIHFKKCARKCYYCDNCRRKQRSLAVMVSRKKKHPEILIGVGSGGHQQGTNNHQYKDGLSNYKDNYRKWNPNIKLCEICGSNRHLVVHHIDGNRKHSTPDNLIMLCRSCHATVHKLAVNLDEIPMVDRETSF